MATPSLSSRLLVTSGICLVALACFVFFVTLPDQREGLRLGDEIENLRNRIQEQRKLGPVYAELARKNRLDATLSLPMPKAAPLRGDQIGEISKTLEGLAAAARLTVSHLTPQPVALGQKNASLQVECSLGGHFLDLRDFLAKVGALPSFRRLEGITIQSGGGVEQFQVTLTFNLEA